MNFALWEVNLDNKINRIYFYTNWILVIIDSGSRYEVAYPSGISHFLEKLAFNVSLHFSKLYFRHFDLTRYIVRQFQFYCPKLLNIIIEYIVLVNTAISKSC